MKKIVFVFKDKKEKVEVSGEKPYEFIEKVEEKGYDPKQIDWERSFRCP